MAWMDSLRHAARAPGPHSRADGHVPPFEHTVLYRVRPTTSRPSSLGSRVTRLVVTCAVRRNAAQVFECGILAHGFCRVRCATCSKDALVAFSCKGRGFCPSCGTRRMVDTAAHLVERVLPDVPVRQWVLALPHRIRFLCAYDPTCAAPCAIFVRATPARAGSAFNRASAAGRARAEAREGADRGDREQVLRTQTAGRGSRSMSGLSMRDSQRHVKRPSPCGPP